jgi:hypothetical protein
MGYKRFFSYLVCLSALISVSGCLATGCDMRPEEVGYENLTLIETLAENAGMTVIRDDMPFAFLTEEASDEAAFLEKAEENNATIVCVITMTQENAWTKRVISKEKKYMAIGGGNGIPLVFEKRYLDPDYPRLTENESGIFYDQRST